MEKPIILPVGGLYRQNVHMVVERVDAADTPYGRSAGLCLREQSNIVASAHRTRQVHKF
jgi:hypothetical protein